MPSPVHPYPSGIKNINYSIISTPSIHQTAPDSPIQGRRGFPRCKAISSPLPPPYVAQLVLFPHWILTYLPYYITSTVLITKMSSGAMAWPTNLAFCSNSRGRPMSMASHRIMSSICSTELGRLPTIQTGIKRQIAEGGRCQPCHNEYFHQFALLELGRLTTTIQIGIKHHRRM